MSRVWISKMRKMNDDDAMLQLHTEILQKKTIHGHNAEGRTEGEMMSRAKDYIMEMSREKVRRG